MVVMRRGSFCFQGRISPAGGQGTSNDDADDAEKAGSILRAGRHHCAAAGMKMKRPRDA